MRRHVNIVLLAASMLAAFTAAVHCFVGGQDTLGPLLASSIDAGAKYTLYAVWHMATVVLSFSSLAFLFGAWSEYARPARWMVSMLALLWLAFGLVFVVVALVAGGTDWLLRLPQWTLLLPVGGLGLFGAWRPVGDAARR